MGVKVCRDVDVGRGTQVNTVRRCAMYVPQYALEQRPVRRPRVMHVETCLLHGEGDVRPCHR